MALRDRRVGDARRTLTTTDDTILERFRRRLLDEIDLAELSRLDATQRRVRLERVMGLLVSREGPVMSTGARTELIRRVVNEALGLGVLEPLLADRTITEIMVNGADTIYVERFGRIEQVNARFTSNDQLMQTIDRIVAGVNRRVDESSPMVDARLRSGERVNVVLPPLSLNGPTLTIRRFPRPFSMEELVRRGTLSQPAADLLAAIVRAKLNVVVSGGTGAGKTTMLNALSAFISGSERIITIEDAAAAAPATACRLARGTSGQHRRRRPGDDSRPRAERVADAPRPHHHRRGPWRRDAGHAAGDEHRP